MCRQLAYFSAGDTGMFDVIKLAYSLCTYYEVRPFTSTRTPRRPEAWVTTEGTTPFSFKLGEVLMAGHICCARATSPLIQTSEKAAPYVTREGLSSNATRLSMKLVEDSLKVLLAVYSSIHQ